MANGGNKPAKREGQQPKKAAGPSNFRLAGGVRLGVDSALDPLAQRTVMAMQARSGPLPHGEEFASYEQTLPGAANRILGMAEKEQEARLLENKIQLFAKYIATFLGQGASAWLVFTALRYSFDLAMHGHEKTAIAIGTGAIASVLGAFLGPKFIAAISKDKE